MEERQIYEICCEVYRHTENSTMGSTHREAVYVVASNEEEANRKSKEHKQMIKKRYQAPVYFWDTIQISSSVRRVEVPGFKIKIEPLEQKVSSE